VNRGAAGGSDTAAGTGADVSADFAAALGGEAAKPIPVQGSQSIVQPNRRTQPNRRKRSIAGWYCKNGRSQLIPCAGRAARRRIVP
jgi:hypothetical protein